MEAEEETGGSANLKRQREPLSDSEDNIVSAPEMTDGLKRRRLEAAGQENRSPRPSTSGRLAELLTKPDTPIIPSVRSRVQLLTQRGSAQHCHSDPGAEDPPVLNKGVKEHFLGKDEFNQRMERFKAPLSTPCPTPIQSPTTPCQQTGSDFVSGMQQKLLCTTTPSSKQASLIRQEREMELNQLPFQPISKNAWLKRSSSDSSVNHQVDGDAEMKDGSFTETLGSAAERPFVNMTAGEGTSSEAPTSSAEFEFFSEGHKQKPHHGEEDEHKKEHKSSPMNKEEQPDSQHLETQTLLELSFNEEHSSSELQKADKHRFLQSSLLDESNMKETSEVSKVTEGDISEEFTFCEGETMDNSSYGEELMEPSTDEDLRIWRYPQSRAEESVTAEEKQVFPKEMEGLSKSPREDKEKEDSSTNYQKLTDIQDVKFSSSADVSSELAGFPKQQEEEKPEMRSSVDNSTEGKSDLNSNKKKIESSEDCCEEMTTQNDDTCQQLQESQAVCVKYKARALEETQSGNTNHGGEAEDVDLPSGKFQTCGNGRAQSSTDIQVSDSHEMETSSTDGRQGVLDGLTAETHKVESSRKVTFILEPELINSSTLTESDTSMESRTETSLSDAGLSSHDETNTSETIDKMFEEVLECAGEVEEKERLDEETVDHDSGIGACSGVEDKMEPDIEKRSENDEECDESRNLDGTGDELLTFPAGGILSPLSKSVEAAVTPLRLAATQKFDPPSEDISASPGESAPLYSVDAYRTQRQSKLLTVQSVTPAVQRQTPGMTRPQPSVNTKERITALNEEASKLQTVINQTLQALSCCTDEEHGRGSLEEAEAEKLLLVSCEKRSALLAEVARLREERSSESEEATKKDTAYTSQQPCRGTVSITNIQLPLKVEFVCSSQNRAGRPTHYFFVLIRYGPCNIIATPLATAADAQNGDAIFFPTSVTMKDIRSSFEIDVEVYSLSHTSSISSTTDRTSTKSRVTPRKLLNTIAKSSNTLTTSANARRSSNFCLVGSHKITLTSLGCNKFPLDKMKFEGKIRKLLGDEFQDKVPFLSPLEGNIYLKLDSKGHSDVQHQGFLTMFELISGFGVWNRQFFVLEGCNMFYWNHPNEKETKEAVGSVSLTKLPNQCVRPVKREACARPFTFELVETAPQLEDLNQQPLSKCWFSADAKQERLDWMEKLNQALLDFHTWKRPQPNPPSSGNLRESIL